MNLEMIYKNLERIFIKRQYSFQIIEEKINNKKINQSS